MEYFISKDGNSMVGVEDNEVIMFDKVGSQEVETKRKSGRPKKEEEDEPEKPRKAYRRMTPEVMRNIKVQITKGEAPATIAEEFGVTVGVVYQLKSKMKAEKASETFTGGGIEEEEDTEI